MFTPPTDSTDPDPTGGHDPAPTFELIGYTADGKPVYSRNGAGQFVQNVPGGGYVAYAGTVTPTPPATTTPAPTPAPAPHAAPGSGLVNGFPETFTPPTQGALPTLPTFQAPSGADALNDPGYKFRTQQGEDALQNWAAAKGTLNDSATGKAMIDYGQNAASQEYGTVWNRAWEAFQPQLLGYTTGTAAMQHQNDMAWQEAHQAFMDRYNIFRNRQLDTVNAAGALG